MVLFVFSILLVTVFFAILVILSAQSRSVYFMVMNLLGFLAGGLSLILEYQNNQTKISVLILLSVIVIVLSYDLAHILIRLFHDKRNKYEHPKIWNRVMNNRRFKMIFHENIYHEDVERLQEAGMTEKLQSLQMWKLGNQSFLKQHLQDALDKYELSIKWLPTSVAWINKSGVYFEQEEYDQVILCCDEAIKINPDRDEPWLNRGLAFGTKKEHKKAVKSFQEALIVNQNNPETHTLLGNATRRIGNLEQALESYDQAIKIDPQFMDVWYHKGITLGLMGRSEEAIECFEQALSLKPKFPMAQYHLANQLNKLHRNEEAIQAYRKALKVSSDFPEAWNNLGIAQSKLGKLKDSIKSYQNAINLKPDYYEAWLNKALASESLNKYENALIGYRKFLELAPDSLTKHRAIARKHVDEIEDLLASSERENKRKFLRKGKEKNLTTDKEELEKAEKISDSVEQPSDDQQEDKDQQFNDGKNK